VVDLTTLTSWNSDWSGVRALVLGLDARTFSVVDTLAELGATVSVVEPEPGEYGSLVEVVGATFVDAASGDYDIAFVAQGRELPAGVTPWTDLELAWRVRDKVRTPEWVSISGSPPLTADLAVHLFASDGRRVAGVGHGNVPVLDAIRDPEGFDILVVEYAAPDLRESSSISPAASVCISGDDGLDRVYENTRIACLYNKADERTTHFVEEAEVIDGCRAIGFDLGTPGPSDLGMVGDIVVDRAFHELRHKEALELTTHGELSAAGLGKKHEVTAVLAASALARALDVDPATIRSAIAGFVRPVD
jgi:UDP-N-acetylmuramoylalanine--D-glutamate ligase